MNKSGLHVPVAALLSAVFAATAGAQADATKAEPLAGNPLWQIRLGDLTETRARPLFSPARRPPPVVAALPAPSVRPGPPRKPEPDHPLLTLLGTIVSASVEIGLFVDEASHDVIRLKAGDVHDGWTLSSVVGRAAIFQKDGYRATTLVLPASRAEANAPSVPPAITFAPPVIPAATKGGTGRPPREG